MKISYVTVTTRDLMRNTTCDKFTVHTPAVGDLRLGAKKKCLLPFYFLIRHYEITRKGISCHAIKLPPAVGIMGGSLTHRADLS